MCSASFISSFWICLRRQWRFVSIFIHLQRDPLDRPHWVVVVWPRGNFRPEWASQQRVESVKLIFMMMTIVVYARPTKRDVICTELFSLLSNWMLSWVWHLFVHFSDCELEGEVFKQNVNRSFVIIMSTTKRGLINTELIFRKKREDESESIKWNNIKFNFKWKLENNRVL